MRVMMSAAGSPVARGIIRHLQSLGHYVIGHDCSPYGSVADEFHVSPRPTHNPTDYYNFIKAIEHDIYLPFLDEELRLDMHYPAGWFRSPISPRPTLDIFTSKIMQQRALEEVRLPVPELWEGHDWGICKPDHGRGGKDVKLTQDPRIIGILRSEGYLTQQFIDGDEYTVDALIDRDGMFLFAVPRLRIAANGVSIIGKIAMDQDIIRLVYDIAGEFCFAGPINVQIIREKDTGKLYIIEINPRLSGSCMFTVMAGFDILQATIRMHFGLPFEQPKCIKQITVKRHYIEEWI